MTKTKSKSILRSFIFWWLLFGHSSHRFPLLTSSGRRRWAQAGSAPFHYSEASVFLFSLGFRIMQTKHENKNSLRWRRTAFTNLGNFNSSLRHPSPFSRTSLLAPCQSILNPAPLRSLLTKDLKVYSEAFGLILKVQKSRHACVCGLALSFDPCLIQSSLCCIQLYLDRSSLPVPS